MRPLAMFRSVLLVAAAGTACDRSLPTNLKPRATRDAGAATAPEANNFVAHLTGSDEVPRLNTRAVGQCKFELNDDASELAYGLIWANMQSAIPGHRHIVG